jgi:hypothetical protein
MKRFAIGLLIGTVTLGTAAFAQTDPNTPTGPNNPNPPSQLTGSRAAMPCAPAANVANNGAGATPQSGSAGQQQAAQGNRQMSDAKDKPSADTGCAAQDHPAGGPAPAPANARHP